MSSSSLLAAQFSAPGNSSVDVYARVSRTLSAQNKLAPQLNAALTKDKTELSGLGQLKSALSSFQSVAQSLSGGGLSISAASSVKEVLTANTSSSANSGTYAIVVNQLAQGQVLSTKAQASQSATIGTGAATTLKFDFGTTQGNNFVPGSGSTSKSVVLQNGDNTLQGIAAAINSADIGVKAQITHGSTGYALSLSAPSGTANTLRIGVSGDATVQNLLRNDPGGIKNLSQTSAAQNANLTVNGAVVVSQSNDVKGAVTGTTLNLTAKGATSLVVSKDFNQIAKNISELANSYNTLHSKLKTLQAGDLQNEGSPNRIQSQITRSLTAPNGDSSDPSALTLDKIGIKTQKNGELAVDSAKLQAAVLADPGAVGKLFTDGGKGIADKLSSQIEALTGSSGTIARETANLNKDIAALNSKKASLAKALTIQANFLANQYSQQASGNPFDANGTNNNTTNANGSYSLIDLLG